ncbi:hypothetical protein LXL04_016664 [Taraxacum kok-saghyz]
MAFATAITSCPHLHFPKRLSVTQQKIRCSSTTSSLSTNFDLKTYWSTLREEINQKLDEAIPVQYPSQIYEFMRYSVLAEGAKRAQPVMCVAAYELLGGNRLAAFPTACALEVVHVASLIHDYLPCMDDDPSRHGQPSNHTVYDSFYCQEENPLQITKHLPLQDVPIYEIESFTSQPSHLQGVDNSVCALEWLKSQEVVPVLKSQRLVKPKQKGTKVYAKGIKSLIKKFAKLDIKSECKALVVRSNKSRAIVVKRKGSRAVVVRKNGSGALVKNKPKKPKLHAWVDLDDESLRNNGSQPFEETDNDNKEWWERHRNVFRGRVDSFIAKMHLIQGTHICFFTNP